MVKKPYSPGFQGKKRRKRRSGSEFDKQLREKQKLKNYYRLKEYQFREYVKKAFARRGRVADTQTLLIQSLEKRLDNVVFRLGFAGSRVQARQIVNHGHILVNAKKINIPSYQVEKKDKIGLAPNFQKSTIFQNLELTLKNYQTPKWLKLDSKKIEGEIIGEPSFEESAPPADISTIFEYYSR